MIIKLRTGLLYVHTFTFTNKVALQRRSIVQKRNLSSPCTVKNISICISVLKCVYNVDGIQKKGFVIMQTNNKQRILVASLLWPPMKAK